MNLAEITIRAVKGFFEHRCHQLAAAISYYALLSLLPLLYFSVLIAGTLIGSSESATTEVLGLFGRIFPGPVPGLTTQIHALVGGSGIMNSLALVCLFLGAGMVFRTIEYTIAHIYGFAKSGRSVFRGLFWGQLMVLGLGIAIVSTHFASAALSWMAGKDIVFATVPLSRIGEKLYLRWGPSVFVFMMFLAILYLAPRIRPPKGPSILISVLLTVSWELVRAAFTWYTSKAVPLSVVYGPLASVIAFIVFVYFSAVLLLLGAEFLAQVVVNRTHEG